MGVGDIILGILFFILGLLFLISIHEFGHFIAAKIFGVYCFEFSIGFGKKIIRRKKKYQETYFCIGTIPLGGYVSMLGEDTDETSKKKEETKTIGNTTSLNSEITFEDENVNNTNTTETQKQEPKQEFTVIKKEKYKLFKKQNKLIKEYIKKYLKDKENNSISDEELKSKAEEYALNRLGLERLIVEEDFYSVVDQFHLPRERDLEHINRGKKFVIMAAGITMNFIIGYLLYLISYSCFPNISVTSKMMMTSGANEDSIGYKYDQLNQSIINSDGENYFYVMEPGYVIFEDTLSSIKADSNINSIIKYGFDANTTLTDKEGTYESVMLINNTFTSVQDEGLYLDSQFISNNKYNDYKVIINNSSTTWESYIKSIQDNKNIEEITKFYENHKEELEKNNIKLISNKLLVEEESSLIKSLDLSLNLYLAKTNSEEDSGYDIVIREDENGKKHFVTESVSGTLTMGDNNKLSSTYLSFSTYERWLGASSFEYAWKGWCNGTSAIFQSVGNLLVGKGWNQVGGIVALAQQSTTLLKNNPFSVYVKMWGLISVNLAVMNLLPFPGLDGWHLLVTIIESITRKKLNPKFKNWASTIGMIILFAFMAVIFVLDIVKCAGVSL